MSDDLNKIREQEPDRRQEETAKTAVGMTAAIAIAAVAIAVAALLYWVL